MVDIVSVKVPGSGYLFTWNGYSVESKSRKQGSRVWIEIHTGDRKGEVLQVPVWELKNLWQ